MNIVTIPTSAHTRVKILTCSNNTLWSDSLNNSDVDRLTSRFTILFSTGGKFRVTSDSLFVMELSVKFIELHWGDYFFLQDELISIPRKRHLFNSINLTFYIWTLHNIYNFSLIKCKISQHYIPMSFSWILHLYEGKSRLITFSFNSQFCSYKIYEIPQN